MAKKKSASQNSEPKPKKSPAKAPQKKVEPLAPEQSADDIIRERQEKRKESLARIMSMPPLYYDVLGSFWFKPNHRFLEMTPARIKDHFKKRGLSDERYIDGLKETEWLFTHCEESMDKLVDYTGALAGHRTGIYRSGGKQYLVTEEPQGIWEPLPESKEPELFAPFIQALLPDDQWKRFCYWLSIAFRSLRNQDFKPGHAVFLAGPAKCGKSLLQYVVKHVLGGRAANPFYYMAGKTDFNYELIGSEVWSFEDPPSHSDYNTRLEFGERIKDCCNTDTFRAHRKNKDAIEVRIARRIIASVNSQPEHLQRVPPLLDGTDDKVFLFKCEDATHTLDRFTIKEEQQVLDGMGETIPVGQQDRAALAKAFLDEIPTIRAWLLNDFKDVPKAWSGDERMGIRAWQHPELLAVINELSPEAHVLILIDQYCWEPNDPLQAALIGRAHQIDRMLREKCTDGQYSRIVKNAMVLGKYLGRLKKLFPNRVSNRMRTGGIDEWTIRPPAEIKEHDERMD